MIEDFLRTRRDLTPLTARELFEGAAGGEEVFLYDGEAASEGMHPLREVQDFWIVADNGRVCLDLGSRSILVGGEETLLATHAWREESVRILGRPVAPPPRITVGADAPVVTSAPCRSGGDLVVVRRRDDWLLAWRRDLRNSVDLPVLSLHSSMAFAERAALRAADTFEAPAVRKSSRLRDDQRGRVYRWEHAFGAENAKLGSVDEARELAEAVCSELGARPPEVVLGRSTLESCSYHRAGRIVLASTMVDRLTLLHETAHHLAGLALRRQPREPGHGPVFCGLLVGLYVRHAGADLDLARRAAAEHGVSWSEAHAEYVLRRAPSVAPPRP